MSARFINRYVPFLIFFYCLLFITILLGHVIGYFLWYCNELFGLKSSFEAFVFDMVEALLLSIIYLFFVNELTQGQAMEKPKLKLSSKKVLQFLVEIVNVGGLQIFAQ